MVLPSEMLPTWPPGLHRWKPDLVDAACLGGAGLSFLGAARPPHDYVSPILVILGGALVALVAFTGIHESHMKNARRSFRIDGDFIVLPTPVLATARGEAAWFTEYLPYQADVALSDLSLEETLPGPQDLRGRQEFGKANLDRRVIVILKITDEESHIGRVAFPLHPDDEQRLRHLLS